MPYSPAFFVEWQPIDNKYKNNNDYRNKIGLIFGCVKQNAYLCHVITQPARRWRPRPNPCHMMNLTSSTYQHLLAHGVKPSVQRLAVMDYLLAHPTHPTVDVIYRGLSGSMPTLSKATVYNTLRLFVSCGLARQLTIDEHEACYDADMSPHAHFLCTACGRVSDVPLPVSGVSSLLAAPSAGYRVSDVNLYYRGLCPACSAGQPQPAQAAAPESA